MTKPLSPIISVLYENTLEIIQRHKDSPHAARMVLEELQNAYPTLDLDEKFVEELMHLVVGKYPEGELLESLKKSARYYNVKINPFGFDEKVYAKLLCFMKLAALVEDTSGAEINAYKLAIVFGDAGRAIHYLKKNEEQNKIASKKVIFDACLFDLPEGNTWDLLAWRSIFAKNMDDATFKEILPYASQIQEILIREGKAITTMPPDILLIKTDIENQIEKLKMEMLLLESEMQDLNKQVKPLRQQKKEIPKEIEDRMNEIKGQQKENNLQRANLERKLPKVPPLISQVEAKTLEDAAAKVRYKNFKKDEYAAYLYHKYGAPESVFNDYLVLKTKAKNSDEKIPPILILGSKIGLDDYYIIKLNKNDPKGPILGHITACCQSSGRMGSGCAHHGLISENGGFYVLCKGKPPANNDTKKILPKDVIAQSWAWRAKDGALVLDSVEAQPNIKNIPENANKIVQLFNALGNELTTKHQIPVVKIGISGGTPSELGYTSNMPSSEPIDYEGYRDSDRQREISRQITPEQTKEAAKEVDSVATPDNTLMDLFDNDIDNAITKYHSLSTEEKFKHPVPLVLDKLVKKASLAQLNRFLKDADEVDLAPYKNKLQNAKIVSYFLNKTEKTKALEMAKYANKQLYKELLNETIDELIKSSDINRELDRYGYTALIWAIDAGEIDLVKKIMDNGGDIFAAGKYKRPPFYTITYHLFMKNKDPDFIDAQLKIADLILNKWLEESKTDIDKTDAENFSILMRACQIGSPLVKKILELGANKELEGKPPFEHETKTPLLLAVERNHIKAVQSLLEHKAKVTPEAVQLAAQKRNIPMLKLLFAAAEDKKAVSKGIFYGAIQNDDNLEYVKELVNMGADIDDDSYNPLYLALNAGAPQTIAYLLRMKADLHQVSKQQNNQQAIGLAPPPLKGDDPDDERIKLANANIVNCTKQLLRAWLREARLKGDLNKPNTQGKTLLMFACEIGDVEAATELIHAGADVHLKDGSNAGAAYYAALKGLPGVLSILLEKDAKIPFGWQGIGTLVSGKYTEHWLNFFPVSTKIIVIKHWAEEFKRLGTDINTADPHGRTLLSYASHIGDINLVKELVDNGAKVDTAALHAGIRSGNIEVVSFLLAKGAAITDKTLSYAVHNGNRECVALLLEKGATGSKEALESLKDAWKLQQTSNELEFIRALLIEHQRKLELEQVKPASGPRSILQFSESKPRIEEEKEETPQKGVGIKTKRK